MKHNKYPQDQSLPNLSRQTLATNLSQNPGDFAPSADEVARRAYFCYVNEGSRPGRDVQHWLEAEKQLLVERNLMRVHGFHDKT